MQSPTDASVQEPKSTNIRVYWRDAPVNRWVRLYCKRKVGYILIMMFRLLKCKGIPISNVYAVSSSVLLV